MSDYSEGYDKGYRRAIELADMQVRALRAQVDHLLLALTNIEASKPPEPILLCAACGSRFDKAHGLTS